MCLIESRSHAVDSEWQGWQEAQSLPGWAVGDVLSSMPRCPPGSLRSVQLPLDHLVEKRDRAVCHRRSNGRRSHVPAWWVPWCSVCGEEEGSKNRSLRNPSDQLMCFGYLPTPGHPEGPTGEIGFKPAKRNPSDTQRWEGGQEDLMIDSVKSSRKIEQNEDWWFGICLCDSQGFSDWE